MDWIALGARVLLAVVFTTAAVGKFADRPGSQRALEDFGVARRWSGGLAVLLPVAELITAAALLFPTSARWGAAAALVLLTLFVIGIAAAMRRGEEPDCHCFGQISSSPAGWRTLIRNAALGMPAILVVVYGPGLKPGSSLSGGAEAEFLAAAAGAVIIALGALVVQLWVDTRRLREDVERKRESLSAFPAGLPLGARAPRFELPTLDGHTLGLEALLARGRPVAIVFVSPNCISCRTMLPDLARWQKALPDRITIAPVAAGKVGKVRELAEEYGLQDVLVQHDAEVFEMYRAAATPSVLIVTPDGLIGSPIRSTAAIVEALIRHHLQTPSDAPRHTHAAGNPNGDALRVSQWSAARGSS